MLVTTLGIANPVSLRTLVSAGIAVSASLAQLHAWLRFDSSLYHAVSVAVSDGESALNVKTCSVRRHIHAFRIAPCFDTPARACS